MIKFFVITQAWKFANNFNFKLTMTTLRELKPSGLHYPVATYAEYKGRRYLISTSSDWFTAEKIACDFQQAYIDAGWYTTDIFDSTCIDGRTKAFKQAYNSNRLHKNL